VNHRVAVNGEVELNIVYLKKSSSKQLTARSREIERIRYRNSNSISTAMLTGGNRQQSCGAAPEIRWWFVSIYYTIKHFENHMVNSGGIGLQSLHISALNSKLRRIPLYSKLRLRPLYSKFQLQDSVRTAYSQPLLFFILTL